jgi:hypothetical protein
LIKETTMRHTTRLPHKLSLAALLFTSACMGQVGDDPGGGSRPKKDGGTPAGCENPTEITEPVTIRSDADFAKLPTDCWDLFEKLRLEGPGIVSLAKLGTLKGVNDLELVDTNLKTIDTKLPLAVYGAVTITGNKQLASLANMPVDNADNLTATYTIRGNPLLASLDGLKYIKTVEGELRISDNAALTDISLDELTSVTGALTIANTGATRIDLGSLQTVTRLEISGNTKLTTFDGLAASTIKGDFVLRGNQSRPSGDELGHARRRRRDDRRQQRAQEPRCVLEPPVHHELADGDEQHRARDARQVQPPRRHRHHRRDHRQHGAAVLLRSRDRSLRHQRRRDRHQQQAQHADRHVPVLVRSPLAPAQPPPPGPSHVHHQAPYRNDGGCALWRCPHRRS